MSQGSASNSSAYIDLNADGEEIRAVDEDEPPIGDSSRPIGRKAEKAKRRKSGDFDTEKFLEEMSRKNDDIFEKINQTLGKQQSGREDMTQMMMLKLENDKRKIDQKDRLIQLEREREDREREREDREVLMINLQTIADPRARAIMQKRQDEIMSRAGGYSGGPSGGHRGREYPGGTQHGGDGSGSGGYGGGGYGGYGGSGYGYDDLPEY